MSTSDFSKKLDQIEKTLNEIAAEIAFLEGYIMGKSGTPFRPYPDR